MSTGVIDDDMEESLAALRKAVVGQRIVEVSLSDVDPVLGLATLTLVTESGRRVRVTEGGECCAYSEITGIRRLGSLDNVITAVVADEGYERWTVLAGADELLGLDVEWSEGSGHYTYALYVEVTDIES